MTQNAEDQRPGRTNRTSLFLCVVCLSHTHNKMIA